jgi:hypothetical protein
MFWDGNRQRILGGGITQNNVLGRTKNLGGSYFAGGELQPTARREIPFRLILKERQDPSNANLKEWTESREMKEAPQFGHLVPSKPCS